MKKNLISKKYIKKSKVSKKYTKIQHGGDFNFNDIKTIEEIQKTFLEDIDCAEPIAIIYKKVIRLIHTDTILRTLKVKYPNESKNDIKLKYDSLRDKYEEYTKAVNNFKKWADQKLSKDITWDNAIKEAKILLAEKKILANHSSRQNTDELLRVYWESRRIEKEKEAQERAEQERIAEQERKAEAELKKMTNTYNLVTRNNLSNYKLPKQPKKSILNSMRSLFTR